MTGREFGEALESALDEKLDPSNWLHSDKAWEATSVLLECIRAALASKDAGPEHQQIDANGNPVGSADGLALGKQDPNDLAWQLDCAAQGEMGPFDDDHGNGWTARLLRRASSEIIRLRAIESWVREHGKPALSRSSDHSLDNLTAADCKTALTALPPGAP